MKRFVKPLAIITKRSILDVAVALDPPLVLAIVYIVCVTGTTQLTFICSKSTIETLEKV